MDVVQPTNAVSATRKTLKGSTKNCSCPISKGPSMMTRRVNVQLARKVPRPKATLASGAQPRAPKTASTRQPVRGIPRSNHSSISFLFEFFQMLQIQAVELLANLEEEHAENQRPHQDIQGDAKLHDHGHAMGRADSSKEQPVLHRQKPDDL